MTNGSPRSMNPAMLLSGAALVLAAIALVVALGNKDDAVQERQTTGSPATAINTSDDARQRERDFQQDLAIARLRLLAVRARLGIDRNFDVAREETAEIRRDLEASFERLPENLRASWEGTKKTLDSLEDQLREGSSEALRTLETLIRALRVELQTDD